MFACWLCSTARPLAEDGFGLWSALPEQDLWNILVHDVALVEHKFCKQCYEERVIKQTKAVERPPDMNYVELVRALEKRFPRLGKLGATTKDLEKARKEEWQQAEKEMRKIQQEQLRKLAREAAEEKRQEEVQRERIEKEGLRRQIMEMAEEEQRTDKGKQEKSELMRREPEIEKQEERSQDSDEQEQKRRTCEAEERPDNGKQHSHLAIKEAEGTTLEQEQEQDQAVTGTQEDLTDIVPNELGLDLDLDNHEDELPCKASCTVLIASESQSRDELDLTQQLGAMALIPPTYHAVSQLLIASPNNRNIDNDYNSLDDEDMPDYDGEGPATTDAEMSAAPDISRETAFYSAEHEDHSPISPEEQAASKAEAAVVEDEDEYGGGFSAEDLMQDTAVFTVPNAQVPPSSTAEFDMLLMGGRVW